MPIVPVRDVSKYSNFHNVTPLGYVYIEESDTVYAGVKGLQNNVSNEESRWNFIGVLATTPNRAILKLLSIHPDIQTVSILDGSDFPAILIKLLVTKEVRLISPATHFIMMNNIDMPEDIAEIIRVSSDIWLDKILESRNKASSRAALTVCHYADKYTYNLLQSIFPNSGHLIVGIDIMNTMYDTINDVHNRNYIKSKEDGSIQKYLKILYDEKIRNIGRDDCDIYFDKIKDESYRDKSLDLMLSRMRLDPNKYDFDKAHKIIDEIDLDQWKSRPELVEFYENHVAKQ